jgi:predicted GNAT superfamily acetyltransferase
MTPNLIWALAYSGNYAVGAWADQTLVGASVAFLGREHGSITLHSHITGVTPEVQGGQVGFALKLHQRGWALERGIQEIGWSFDPLVRRNAWFNLVKLGGVATAYHPNFYGPMNDDINAGDETDRCVVAWNLTAPKVVARCAGRVPDPAQRHTSDAVLLEEDRAGAPVMVRAFSAGVEDVWLCRIPADIEECRRSNPAQARAWRLALRETMGAAMAAGYLADAVTREGCYVLTSASKGGTES